jgi:hypothetical protein
VLPGQCFGLRDYIRIVICPPSEVVGEAFVRLAEFCKAHCKADSAKDKAMVETEKANEAEKGYKQIVCNDVAMVVSPEEESEAETVAKKRPRDE